MEDDGTSAGFRPERPGLLLNPRAGRVRGRLEAYRRLGRDLAGAHCREAVTPAEITAALDQLTDVDLLVVAGGDGTLQAVLSHFEAAGGAPPVLFALPAGTTNMSARDLGVAGRPERLLRGLATRLARPGAELAVHRRRALRMDLCGAAPVAGMFLGAGVIASGVEYFRERVRRLGVTGEKASALAALRVLLPLLAGRRDGPIGPVGMELRFDDGTHRRSENLLLLVTALDRLLFGSRPYWSPGPGALHCTAVEHAPRALLRALPRLHRGSPGRVLTEANGYHSWNVDHLDIHLNGGIVVDGEVYAASRALGPVRVSATAPVGFARP